jgi:hypothetical protein
LESPQQASLSRFRHSLRPLVYKKLSGYLGPEADRENHYYFPYWQAGLTNQIALAGGIGLSNSRQAQYILLRSRAIERQVVHQTTHSLARFFLELDANYKQYSTAQRQRSDAQKRLDAHRAYYDEGRITIDRFIDAISAYAAALTLESRYKVTYNISLAARSEAKGALLSDRNIVIAECARHYRDMQAAQTKIDAQAKTVSYEPTQNEPTVKTPTESKPKTWTFSISIGWDEPLQIKGTISVDDHRAMARYGTGHNDFGKHGSKCP